MSSKKVLLEKYGILKIMLLIIIDQVVEKYQENFEQYQMQLEYDKCLFQMLINIIQSEEKVFENH
jgi:hypothetical protein